MKTLALVLGNDNYPGNARLDNAVNDAESVAETFVRLNYDVILEKDSSAIQCSEILEKFESEINKYDASIFYYAGHGFEFNGENYLSSIECPIEHPTRHMCERTCIRLSEITDIIKNSSTKVNIIIIDACRKNVGRGTSNSFSPINVPEGTILAFSTSPGEGAKDAGPDGHSLYTGTLLKYIGRELLSVEELFKKVRKTVYNLSDGAQTSWEHTSLVGDFYFNTGQMVFSVAIPYDESVVKDRLYTKNEDSIDQIIQDLKSSNWNVQNPAMDRLRKIAPKDIDKDRQFLIGRNILQSAGYAFNSSNFLENLQENLERFNSEGENHLLNGLLFEVYFDNNGDFRKGKLKNDYLGNILDLRNKDIFKNSFVFISEALEPHKDYLFYIPGKKDSIIDIDIVASEIERKDFFGKMETFQLIDSIICENKNITDKISLRCETGRNLYYLKIKISDYIAAPFELININNNIDIDNLIFKWGMTADLIV